ncbi:MAG: hypothetical protein LBP35_06860 [Candidatus Ancillula trichonymphae]|nr:hypothetical protein [Candidatus Ancillula trichonymphae]
MSDALWSSNAADFKRDFKPAGELTTPETFAEVSARNLASKLEVLQSRLASTRIEIAHELKILGDIYEALDLKAAMSSPGSFDVTNLRLMSSWKFCAGLVKMLKVTSRSATLEK